MKVASDLDRPQSAVTRRAASEHWCLGEAHAGVRVRREGEGTAGMGTHHFDLMMGDKVWESVSHAEVVQARDWR